MTHRTHPEIMKRLRRAEGHLKSTIVQLAEGKSCKDLAQQLHAVEKAIANAKKLLIHDHIDHCLAQHMGLSSPDVQNTVSEFREISKYL